MRRSENNIKTIKRNATNEKSVKFFESRDESITMMDSIESTVVLSRQHLHRDNLKKNIDFFKQRMRHSQNTAVNVRNLDRRDVEYRRFTSDEKIMKPYINDLDNSITVTGLTQESLD